MSSAERRRRATANGPRSARDQIEGAAISLADLRRARGMSQAALADGMGSAQAEISRLERRGDHRVTTLHKVIDAMGGRLEIVARFPKGKAYALRLAALTDGREL